MCWCLLQSNLNIIIEWTLMENIFIDEWNAREKLNIS